MAYRNTPRLIFPVGDFKNISSGFGEMNVYDDTLWGKHLGIDIAVPGETKVFAIGRGIVVYSKLHSGEFSEDGKILKRNWGGIIIIAHKNPKDKKVFYSVYGHLGRRYFKKGDLIEIGDMIGLIGKSMTESNGAWEEEHLHFGIYSGPFHGKVLPGYFKENDGKRVTEPEDWKDPVAYIKYYNEESMIN
jgi:murein DD-endopeptidase MepM/ murein hydrolase activator NlpD